MKLAIFDIDGTLTDSSDVDTRCFLQAVSETFGIDDVDTDWSRYSHATDRAIIADLTRQKLCREVTGADLTRERSRFLQLLSGCEISEIPGAKEFLSHLELLEWTCVAATGTWLDAARMKLSKAGLPPIPISACDETESREAIVENAMALVPGNYDRVVLFGDGTWDVRTASHLRLPFIGIGDRAHLLEAGALFAFTDYREPGEILRAIDAIQR